MVKPEKKYLVVMFDKGGEVYTEDYAKEYYALQRAKEMFGAMHQHIAVIESRRTIIFERYS